MNRPDSDPTRSIEPRMERHALPSGVELSTVRWSPAGDVDHHLPPCLLVHGLASNARLWDGVAWRLAEAGHDVVAVDQRGHGHSSKPDGGYDMATVADDLELLLTDLGWEAPLVAGQSWGGNVVIEFAHRHPGRATAIACVDGGFIELQDRFPVWEDAAEMMAPPKLIGTPLERITQWMADSNPDWPEEGRAGQLANFEVRDDGTIAPWLTFDRHLQVLRGLWEHRPSTLFPDIDTPVLWIPAADGDSAWTASKRAAIDAAIRSLVASRVEWFQPAHHDVHAQHPAEVAALLHRAATEPDWIST